MSYELLVVKTEDDVLIELLKQFNIPTTPFIYRESEEEKKSHNTRFGVLPKRPSKFKIC